MASTSTYTNSDDIVKLNHFEEYRQRHLKSIDFDLLEFESRLDDQLSFIGHDPSRFCMTQDELLLLSEVDAIPLDKIDSERMARVPEALAADMEIYLDEIKPRSTIDVRRSRLNTDRNEAPRTEQRGGIDVRRAALVSANIQERKKKAGSFFGIGLLLYSLSKLF